MPLSKAFKRWLPLLISILGISLSVLIWYNLKRTKDDFNLLADLPNLILIFGLTTSILLGALLQATFLTRQRKAAIKRMHETIKHEVNERLQVEDSKQKLEVALLQGQKLQAMGTLAGGIAHDFNNILYAIIGYTEIAREDVPKDSLVYKNLGKVLEGAHRGQELVSRILSFTRRQHHQFNELPIKTTIEAALSLLRPTIPASVIIVFEPEIDAVILGNQTQLHQILVNLINNAVDAMDGEGTITIHVSRLSAGDPFLRQFADTGAQNYCRIDISDTGHGMDQHTMERIFEPFYTTKEVGKGTGLGLSIVHSIIKEHQGEIIVESQLGHGTTFTIILPEYHKET